MSLILYPAPFDFHWMKQRPQQLLLRLARLGHTVYYCNKSEQERPVEEVEPGFYIIHQTKRWLQEEWPLLRKNSGQAAGVWCSYPLAKREWALWSSDWVIYDCVDDYAPWREAELDTLQRAGVVVCASERLTERMLRLTQKKPVVTIRNGYDTGMGLHRVDAKPEPTPFAAVEPGWQPQGSIDNECGQAEHHFPGNVVFSPVAGYIGAWAPWVDEALLRRCRKEIAGDWSLEIIGPEFGRAFPTGVGPEGGEASSGWRFHGMLPHADLPERIRSFSVGLIPFRRIPVALAASPVKAYEYLAAGLPVVTTDLPECRTMAPHVDVAVSTADFIRLLQVRLNNPGSKEDRSARIRYALEHTWERRAEQADRLIRSLESGSL
ncbi:glycosyltransferase family protein [Gorillibacterium timonense]|uniref:glycosyltransferase family protein n=1 Tax=Gorillibacterium timonense TaxID=1689269 RepID=UPI00071C5F2E|nr:glycosyltransferase [Gorillibacterium timonense]